MTEEKTRGPPWNLIIVLVLFIFVIGYALYLQIPIKEITGLGLGVKFGDQTSKPTQNNSDTTGSNELFWDFAKDFDGWERIGSAAPWKTEGLAGAVRWHGEWADGIGVIVMDACEADQINASAGIKNNIKIPNGAKRVEVVAVKQENDGGFRFILIDDSGISHNLGERILSGRMKESFSYNIAPWAGKTVILKIMAFGYGTNATKGEACAEESKACCGEYFGVDSIQIA